MDPFEAGLARATFETFSCPEPILEVGSCEVTGQERIADLRRFHPDTRYVGTDLRQGAGVDVVAHVESLPYKDRTFGTVIALNLLEHVPRFWIGIEELQRVMRDDGLLIISCPFYFRVHGFPSDYWRFTPAAFRLLLARMPSKVIACHGPKKRPLSTWGIAAGPEYPPITEAQHANFCTLVRSYARQPLPWRRKLRFRIGRVLCGARPFETFLEAERFETELISGRI